MTKVWLHHPLNPLIVKRKISVFGRHIDIPSAIITNVIKKTTPIAKDRGRTGGCGSGFPGRILG
jgi:hypothetical protein